MSTETEPDFFTDDAVTEAFAEAIAEMRPEEGARDLAKTATAPTDEESEADDTEEEDGEEIDAPDAQPAHNPDGPGNIKAALRESRDAAKAIKAQLDATNARLAAYEAERAQQQAALQQQQQAARIQQAVEDMHPEDIPAYLEQVTRQQQEQMQRQAREQQAWSRLADSEQAARLSLPDYDAQIDKLTSLFDAGMVAAWAQQQQGSPAIAAYTKAKGIFTQSDLDAAREAGRAEALESLPARRRAPQSAPRLADIPAAGRAKDSTPVERLSKRLDKGGDVSGVVDGLFRQAFGG